jgi:protein gp37
LAASAHDFREFDERPFSQGRAKEFIDRVFDTMEAAHWHTFQMLTKRSSLMRNYLRSRYGTVPGPAHIWCGVSIEDGTKLSRMRHLREAPAGVRFLSIEPLIGRIGKLDLAGIDWVIVGGESGPRARPMEVAWVREIRDQCGCFLLQAMGRHPPESGRP